MNIGSCEHLQVICRSPLKFPNDFLSPHLFSLPRDGAPLCRFRESVSGIFLRNRLLFMGSWRFTVLTRKQVLLRKNPSKFYAVVGSCVILCKWEDKWADVVTCCNLHALQTELSEHHRNIWNLCRWHWGEATAAVKSLFWHLTIF